MDQTTTRDQFLVSNPQEGQDLIQTTTRDQFLVSIPQEGQDLSKMDKTRTPKKPKTISPKMVLIFSSTGRSGSSFLGELLSTVNSSVYFFEPDYIIRQNACVYSKDCLSKYLADKFLCQLNNHFIRLFKSNKLF